MRASVRGFERVASVFRRIAGMPDYEAHLEHLRQHHPECPIPTRREFYERFVESRYQEGPTRCC
jgi:uncharacterized short protein YbdD (DUF466 family)